MNLAATRTILIRDPGGADIPSWFRPDDRDRLHALRVDPAVWEDMGRPDTITVTIEPGDRLNG